MSAAEEFDIRLSERAASEAAETGFVVDLEGYEGPLHTLLALARDQKVDLARISILKLADQYLAFVAQARAERIELAADYLVMASWLAYLKSRLLLPKPEKTTEEAPAETLAAALAWRLKRLDAMRAAGEALLNGQVLDRDVFARGAPEGVRIVRDGVVADCDLLDLLRAYARQRLRQTKRRLSVKPWPVYSIEAARERLMERLPETRDWAPLGGFAPSAEAFREPPTPASRYASLVSASLELAKAGRLELRQTSAFEPLFVKSRAPAPAHEMREAAQ